ncbi:unnamed protein product [Callosobruchus maculatus]|uniref:Uncharacterized protein n=1 Tax=Callosobruchus maculatus TaxID=64391 RepID=A0A653CLE1_CALMS|nr:unnamed protein product [Callosobruchus maculatus]
MKRWVVLISTGGAGGKGGSDGIEDGTDEGGKGGHKGSSGSADVGVGGGGPDGGGGGKGGVDVGVGGVGGGAGGMGGGAGGMGGPGGAGGVGGPGGVGGMEEPGGVGGVGGIGEGVPGAMGACTPRTKCKCKKKTPQTLPPSMQSMYLSWSQQYGGQTPQLGGRSCGTCGSPKKPPQCGTCGRIPKPQFIVYPPSSSPRGGIVSHSYSQPRNSDPLAGFSQTSRGEAGCEEGQTALPGCILPGCILCQFTPPIQSVQQSCGLSCSREDGQRNLNPQVCSCSRQSDRPQTNDSNCYSRGNQGQGRLSWSAQKGTDQNTKGDDQPEQKFYYRFQDKACKKHNVNATLMQQPLSCGAMCSCIKCP